MKLKDLKTQEEFEEAFFEAVKNDLRFNLAMAVVRNMHSKGFRSVKVYTFIVHIMLGMSMEEFLKLKL